MLYLFDQNTVQKSTAVKYCYNLKYLFSILIFFLICADEATFQQQFPVLTVTWSSEIIIIYWFDAQ